MSNSAETDVLIVGAGPAGAMSAALLAGLGVRSLMINRRRSTSTGPRSHITNQRTMEILRDLGLEESAKSLSVPKEYMGEHVYAASLAGEEFGRIPAWASHPQAHAEHELASPTRYCDLPQLYFEPLLVSEAALRGADVRFLTEYLGHFEDQDGVTARLFDHVSGVEYEVRAKYIIGADGARSLVAQNAGLPFEGQMGIGDSGSINIEFSADLSSLCEHRKGDMYWMFRAGSGINGVGVAALRMIRPWNKWMCVWGYEKSKGTPEITKEEAKKIIHDIIGTDEIPVEVGPISTWTINQQYAVRNTAGRVFCMGDAVHRHTPMGGLGLNTSVQDAYNLSWKIALVLKGKAAPTLLDSYDAERSPVAKQIVERAYKSLSTFPPVFEALCLPPVPTEAEMAEALVRLKDASEEGAKRRAALRKAMDATIIGLGGGHGVELNQRYVSRAVFPDGTPDPGFVRDKEFFYQSSTRPGAHLPHVWLTENQRRISTLDLCGKGRFTLLTGLSGIAWKHEAERVSQSLGIDLKVCVIGPGQAFVDTYGEYANISEIDESGALLVRPDMFIAFRAKDASQKSLEQLIVAMRNILGRA